ncbi:hypothetical protein BABINDRAFT_126037 [Babjeviella inositovora NRRL Y-12698]|uniref:Cysteine protease RIM13 n=1 Tax=Babjeviella inositovora NRRL Y-12698 TaxID=984486 RepID=A0A1E3QT43_9ASCO|nr:uncharacterized protein BABINDRAFT_126037 [Babjeviella inositovora NRRL Y-12698]ODQ80674.1 hypothetical protein BABINDRAFT_126037 [Babjeviella inositovora NRRL Y-12698]
MMSSLQTDKDVDTALRLIESSKLDYSLNNATQAKLHALKAIKLLNPILKNLAGELDTNHLAWLQHICQDIFAFYEAISTQRALSFDEQLQWLGSKINGNQFPPSTAANFFVASVQSTEDPLRLAPLQENQLDGWKSTSEMFPDQDWVTERGIEDIAQDALSDCSVVASLISIINNDGNLAKSCITPHRRSPKYCVALFANGCRRQTVIDDRLPVLKDGSYIYTRSLTNPLIVWPALVEKAYLKLRGYGYDFIGSNSAFDTYSLIGWVPELVPIENGRFPRWEALYLAFKEKTLLVCIGTGKLSAEVSRDLGLISEHDYAITDLRVSNEIRQVLVKNPWHNLGREMWFDESDLYYFNVLYLSWSPQLYPYQESVNFLYTSQTSCPDNYIGLPQYSITAGSDILNVALLLEMHMGMKPELEVASVNLLVFETSGERLLQRANFLYKGFHLEKSRYKNAFFKLAPGKLCTIVITSAQSQRFSLTAFSNRPLQLQKSEYKQPHQEVVRGTWDVKSAGGNWSNSSYIYNPQYELVVSEPDTRFNLAIWTDAERYVNLHVFHREGTSLLETIKTFDSARAIVNGKYNLSSQIHENVYLPPGKYTLVVSTYDPVVMAPFSVFADSNKRIDIRRLSSTLGLFSKKEVFRGAGPFRYKFSLQRQTDVVVCATSEEGLRLRISVCEASMIDYVAGYQGAIRTEYEESRYGVFCEAGGLKQGQYVVLVEKQGDGEGCVLEIGSSVDIFKISH